MINNGSGRGFEVVRLTKIGAIFGICSLVAASAPLMQLPAWGAKPAQDAKSADKDKKADHKADAKTDKKAEAKTPEPVIENVVDVTTDDLVDKPHEYLNKNVRFNAYFHAYSSLALDYKPAMRSSKNYLSFLVFRPNGSKVPYSELKLAIITPKEKDPENALLISLKEGDELEITGHVFATALDEPWVDVLKLKRLSSAPDKEKTAEESGNKEKKAGETEPEVKGDKK